MKIIGINLYWYLLIYLEKICRRLGYDLYGREINKKAYEVNQWRINSNER